MIVTDDWLNEQALILLQKAEEQYLPRDKSFRFDGVKVDPGGPHIRFHLDGLGVGFEVSPSTQKYPDQALYQIGHEVIHILAPDRSAPAIFFEEGLATYFSIYGPQFQNPNHKQACIEHLLKDPSAVHYRDALDAFEKVISLEPNAVVMLREKQPNFHAMGFDLFKSIIPNISEDFVKLLISRRQMR